jgi:hypothetical protein
MVVFPPAMVVFPPTMVVFPPTMVVFPAPCAVVPPEPEHPDVNAAVSSTETAKR